jgi:hypothetical protein
MGCEESELSEKRYVDYLEIARRAKADFRKMQVVLRQGWQPGEEPADEPILSVEQWYPEFHRFHMAVVNQTPGFDYGWVRHNRPDLYRRIRVKEDEIDALSGARLSHVMALLREWREMVLTAEFERQQFTR